jgi:hypothetical protein
VIKPWSYWLVLALPLLLTPPASANPYFDRANCTYQGKPLYGRVQIVDSLADIKVKIVSDHPDLPVKQVTTFPGRCGEWQIVDSFPTLRVQIVTTLPDITIGFVSTFSGSP